VVKEFLTKSLVTPRGGEWIRPTLTPYVTTWVQPFMRTPQQRLPMLFNGGQPPKLPLLLGIWISI